MPPFWTSIHVHLNYKSKYKKVNWCTANMETEVLKKAQTLIVIFLSEGLDSRR